MTAELALSRSTDSVNWARWRWALHAAVFFTEVFAFADRALLGVLIRNIREDLEISETQFGLLFGILFSVPYIVGSIFLGRGADRFPRVRLLQFTILIWAGATTASAFATTFTQLAIARCLVGLGEAALLPCAYSLLADVFDRHQLGRACSVFVMGVPIGTGLALVCGGMLHDYLAVAIPASPLLGSFAPWQVTMGLMGFPGLLLVIVFAWIPEPVRSNSSGVQRSTEYRSLMRHVIPYAAIVFGFALTAVTLQTTQVFGVQHFVRHFGLDLAESSLRVGLPVVLLGPIGLWMGGWLNDRWTVAGYSQAPLLVGALAAFSLGVAISWAMLVPSVQSAQIGLVLFGFFSTFAFGAGGSALLRITAADFRGTIAAIFTVTTTLVSSGLSPLLTAMVTERVFMSDARVGWSVAVVCGLSCLGAVLLFVGGMNPFKKAALETERLAKSI